MTSGGKANGHAACRSQGGGDKAMISPQSPLNPEIPNPDEPRPGEMPELPEEVPEEEPEEVPEPTEPDTQPPETDTDAI
jgi:hypothetical protein